MNQPIESSILLEMNSNNRKQRVRLFSLLVLTVAISGGGGWAYWELIGSRYVATDNAAYAEHMFGGFVYTEPETVTSALRMFGTITSESDKASVSLRKIERMAEIWNGVSQATQTPTAGTASKSDTATAP